jgi:hypothetical protein
MFRLMEDSSLVERILSELFPPVVKPVETRSTMDYVNRMSRRGVENRPELAWGWIPNDRAVRE